MPVLKLKRDLNTFYFTSTEPVVKRNEFYPQFKDTMK